MELALTEGVVAAVGVDRLADSAQPHAAPRVGAYEVGPRRDDPRRVGTDVAHVRERHGTGRVAECSREHVDLARRDHDEDGFLRGHALPDELAHPRDELVVVLVEEGFMDERVTAIVDLN